MERAETILVFSCFRSGSNLSVGRAQIQCDCKIWKGPSDIWAVFQPWALIKCSVLYRKAKWCINQACGSSRSSQWMRTSSVELLLLSVGLSLVRKIANVGSMSSNNMTPRFFESYYAQKTVSTRECRQRNKCQNCTSSFHDSKKKKTL